MLDRHVCAYMWGEGMYGCVYVRAFMCRWMYVTSLRWLRDAEAKIGTGYIHAAS